MRRPTDDRARRPGAKRCRPGWREAFDRADGRMHDLVPEFASAIAANDAAGMLRVAKSAVAALSDAVPAVRLAAEHGDPVAAVALAALTESRDGFASIADDLTKASGTEQR